MICNLLPLLLLITILLYHVYGESSVRRGHEEALCPDPNQEIDQTSAMSLTAGMKRFLSDPEDVWMLLGSTLIARNVPIFIPFHMGHVTFNHDAVSHVITGRYSLANDIDFRMIPVKEKQDTWIVNITGRTQVMGSPDDVNLEATIQDLFLYDGAELSIHNAVDPRDDGEAQIIISAGTAGISSSVQMFNRPLVKLSPVSVEAVMLGYWKSVEGDMTLTILPHRPQMSMCILRGANDHKFTIEHLEDKTIKVGVVSSTSLKSNETDNETAMLRSIELSSRVVSFVDPVTKIYSLKFTSEETDVSFVFSRDNNEPLSYYEHSFWLWMPETVMTSGNLTDQKNLLAAHTDLSLVLEMRVSEISVVLDVFIDGVACLRYTQMGAGVMKPIQRVQWLQEPEKQRHFATRVKHLLSQTKSVETDIARGFLTLVGPEASLSFSSVPVPSPGVWILDAHYGAAAGVADSHQSYVTFDIFEEGESIRGVVTGTAAGIIHFKLENKEMMMGHFDWVVGHTAVRSGRSETDQLLERFFGADLVSCRVVKGDDMESLLCSSSVIDKQLLFVHPVSLTAAIVGDWKLVKLSGAANAISEVAVHNVGVIFVRSGVGRLTGDLRVGSYSFRIMMKEDVSRNVENIRTLEKWPIPSNTTDVMPVSWKIEIPEESIYAHHLAPPHHSSERRRQSLTREKSSSMTRKQRQEVESVEDDDDNYETIVSQLTLCDHVEVAREGMEMEMSGPGVAARFVKILDQRTRQYLPGKWEVEFLVVESDETVKEADSAYISGRHVLQLHVSSSSIVPVFTENRWRTGVVSYRVAAVPSVSLNQTIAEWDMFVNPAKEVRVENVKWNEVASEFTEDKLRHLLENFLKSTSDRLLEVSRFEALMGDGGSLLALTRAPEYQIMVLKFSDNNTEPLEKLPVPVEDNFTRAVGMMHIVRRRLQAAAQLEKVVTAKYSS